jgi:hypothetical protein
MRITQSSDLTELTCRIIDRAELATACKVVPLGREGLEVIVDRRAVLMPYPIDVDELWSKVSALGEVFDASCAYESLAGEIRAIEGIEVTISIDRNVDDALVDPSANRRVVMGSVVQDVRPYPYKRAMTGNRTWAAWRSIRFQRHYAGLRVALLHPPDENPATMSLEQLRTLTAQRPGQ